ncbi:ATP-binding cassette domain-containing protein [Candidatus Nitrotoga sp. M5]|uniref:ATP-binding cassette domain-containing protein n=1 Tax=Candidatus Nitrotoga sp. M5 TaxID=2890409 RepID=UPI001EF4E00B|nr:ATP-binding cassette domain-containing protein [Candidatus Nitrotoga sp. M5]CAH1387126.1 ABC exporter ATP binding subunit YbhF [Candidatus Nitrotoga sp. M5]
MTNEMSAQVSQAKLSSQPAVKIVGVTKIFGVVEALHEISANILPGRLTGLVGPDGAGKTTLMRLMAALMAPTAGRITVANCDTVRDSNRIHTLTGYMPQRFGLYEDLSVMENLRLYAQLQGVEPNTHQDIFERLLTFTRLAPFTQRLAGRLSGGMKQKLGLACAMMGKPRVLLLDEPSVGVDPVSRQDLWKMVRELTDEGMAVVWSTAYLDEAERCATVLLLNDGKIEYDGPPDKLTATLKHRCFRLLDPKQERRIVLSRALNLKSVCDGVIQGNSVRAVLRKEATREEIDALAKEVGAEIAPVTPRFEDAFVDLLGGGPGGTSALAERMEPVNLKGDIAVECHELTRRFGDFIATDHVSFQVKKGEIFGLLGPNGAGKSTTFKMLCGLLKPTSGGAHVMGLDLRTAKSEAKSQLGYMAQKFSLYGLLSARQNLEFSAGVYGFDGATKRERIEEMIEIFHLQKYVRSSPEDLPLGVKQRLALACALMHRPPVLFLDEPTSGVDPITRREFWTHINGLVRKGVTVLVTTHFMDEAEYCDRVALMYQAKVIALDTPDALKRSVFKGGSDEPTMEDAFIQLIQSADAENATSRATKAP